MSSQIDLLTRRVEKILPSKKGLEQLISKKKIRLYQGFDPSKPNLHIGHLVGLLQLKAFQDAGHEVIFLIGDYTGMIGDPTDKSSTRTKLSHTQVLENAQTYKEQAGKILNFKGENAAKIMFNSEWLSKLNFGEVLELSSNLTVQQLLERDMFQDRIKNQKPIHLHEFMYPLMQGYDSIAMNVDLEVGGNDQLFNMMTGRHLMKILKNKEKFVLTTKLLADSQGTKIGKTTGNAINLFSNTSKNNLSVHANLYGQIMSIPDNLVIPTFMLATTVPLTTIQQYKKDITTKPMKVKGMLASAIVEFCHGQSKMIDAQAHFQSTIQKKEFPQNVQTINVPTGKIRLIDLLKNADLNQSASEVKRIVTQGGVEIDGNKITDPNQETETKSGTTIKFGKRTFRKVK